MRIVHMADLHLGKNFSSTKFDYHTSELRKKTLWTTMENILSFTKNNNAVLLIAGDLFDALPQNHEIIRFINLLKKYPMVLVFAIEGNHDQGLGKKMAALNIDLDNFFYYTKPSLEYYEIAPLKSRVYGSVWNKNMSIEQELDKISLDDAYTNILMLHSSLDNHVDSYLPITKEKLLSYGFDYYALGHIHQYKKIRNNLIFPGSPEPLSFREGGEHGIFIGEIGNETKMNFVQMSKLEYVKKDLEINDLMTLYDIEVNIKNFLSKYGKNHFIRLTLVGSIDRSIDKALEQFILEFHWDVGYVEIVNQTMPNYNIEKLQYQYKDSIIGRFLEKVGNSHDSDEKEITKLGLEALIKE